MTDLNITEGCYGCLRNGAIVGPLVYRNESLRPWCLSGNDYGIVWNSCGKFYDDSDSTLGIVEVLPGEPVFINSPFKVGETYSTRGGGEAEVIGYGLITRQDNGSTQSLNLDGAYLSGLKSDFDLILPPIKPDTVTVTMTRADLERARQLLGEDNIKGGIMTSDLDRECNEALDRMSAIADELQDMQKQIRSLIEAKPGGPKRGDNFRRLDVIEGRAA